MISATGLTKLYGNKPAVRALDFEIERGEVVGLLGRNGAGKTTLLRILACELLPTSGCARIGGIDGGPERGFDVVTQSAEVRRLIGYLPDAPPLYDEMRAEAYLAFAARLRGLSRREARARVAATLERLGLAGLGRDVVATLSHGYRQRLGIAQAIVHDPPVLLLDEPLIGLDPVQIVEMRSMIADLREEHTILLSSHNLPEVSVLCSRFLVIDEGRLVAAGTERELRPERGMALSIELRGGERELAGFLEGRPEVRSFEIASANGDTRRVALELASDEREALARALVEGGFGLLAMTPRRSELDEVFVGLTRSGEAKGGGAP